MVARLGIKISIDYSIILHLIHYLVIQIRIVHLFFRPINRDLEFYRELIYSPLLMVMTQSLTVACLNGFQ